MSVNNRFDFAKKEMLGFPFFKEVYFTFLILFNMNLTF